MIPKFGKGVKLRRDGDGSAMLLVPEGALMLNEPAAATLELIDGKRSIDEIAESLVARFDVELECARKDVGDLIDRLVQRGFLVPAP